MALSDTADARMMEESLLVLRLMQAWLQMVRVVQASVHVLRAVLVSTTMLRVEIMSTSTTGELHIYSKATRIDSILKVCQ